MTVTGSGRAEGCVRAEWRESFAAWAAAELPGLRRFAYAVCGDWHRADDLVQAALERMYVSWSRIQTVNDPGAYARTVVVRLAVSETRRPWWRRVRVTDVVPEATGRDGADGTDGTVDRLDLAQALDGLTVKQRAIVVLRFLEDRPVADVAGLLGISAGTVKRQCSDALGHLRRRLAAENDAGLDDEAMGDG